MNLRTAVKITNSLIKEKQPKTFSSSWIFANAPTVYQFIRRNFRTENDHIDWDSFTLALKPEFAKRWVRYRYKTARPYENQQEMDVILNKHHSKLYTLIVSTDDKDRKIRDQIIIALVRISQKGNVLARRELTKWMRFAVDDWVEKYYPLFKWRGYGDDIDEKIVGCIRCYKYTGTFVGYLYKTLEYSARGMRSLQAWSLDYPVGEDGATKIDFVIQDTETGEVKLFGR